MGMESHASSKSDGDEYQIMKSIIIIPFTYTLTMLNYSTMVTTLAILFTVFHIIILYISQAWQLFDHNYRVNSNTFEGQNHDKIIFIIHAISLYYDKNKNC